MQDAQIQFWSPLFAVLVGLWMHWLLFPVEWLSAEYAFAKRTRLWKDAQQSERYKENPL